MCVWNEIEDWKKKKRGMYKINKYTWTGYPVPQRVKRNVVGNVGERGRCCQGDISMATIVRQMLDETGFSKCGAVCWKSLFSRRRVEVKHKESLLLGQVFEEFKCYSVWIVALYTIRSLLLGDVVTTGFNRGSLKSLKKNPFSLPVYWTHWQCLSASPLRSSQMKVVSNPALCKWVASIQ